MSSQLAYIGDPGGVLATFRELIFAAQDTILLQMYLFARNGDQTLLLPRAGAFPYADTVAGWLIERRRASPQLAIVVLLDSNTPADPRLTRRRGPLVREDLERAGIPVLCANLFGARFDPRPRRLLGRMNLHLAPRTLVPQEWVRRQNQWQVLHNVEDHRKNLVIDGGRAGAITSHNLFDPAFDWHENTFLVSGELGASLWRSAQAAVRAALEIPQALDDDRQSAVTRALARAPHAGSAPPLRAPALPPVEGYPGELDQPSQRSPLLEDERAALLESGEIRGRVEALFSGAGEGDELLVASTYFSDLEALSGLEQAARRGARVRVLIDSVWALPLPGLAAWLTRSLVNHQVTVRACELAAELPGSFELRVHDSRDGRMMHLKTAARLGASPALIGGQANFTPNSFSGAWLETDVETTSDEIVQAFARHFEELWRLPATRRPRYERGLSAALGRRVRSAALGAFAWLGLRP